MNQAAVDQLEQLSSRDGAIQLQATFEDAGRTVFKVSLDTRRIQHAKGGIRVRGREVFFLAAADDFPLSPPSVIAAHRRWAGTAHVQWGSQLCIYAAPSVEWSPADGMRGLIDRLMLWLERAALGALDPEGQPLHPPVAYSKPSAGHLVVRADVGALAPWGAADGGANVLYAWCVAEGERVDVVAWLDYDAVADRVTAADFDPRDSLGRPQFVAIAGFISDQIAFEYPEKAQALLDSLERSGLSSDRLLSNLSRARLVNSHIESKLGDGTALANVILLGTPSRRIDRDLLAHLSAWRLEDIGNDLADLLAEANWGVLQSRQQKVLDLVRRWLGVAEISWMRVWEDRPEVTRPRDGGTMVSTLHDRRVLVLGAGALGGPISEFCVRAGVSELVVADEGRVGPGILARQPYADADISKPKARVLADRLSAIRPSLVVRAVPGDAKDTVLASAPVRDGFDLVIDATADVGVRTAIEVRRSADREGWPDILTLMIGHDATRGIVTYSRTGTSGGPVDVLRRLALESVATSSLQDVAADFFPDSPRGDMFFPEPGCSSPTFIGSQADVSSLAGMLLNEGLALVSDTDLPMGAAVVRRADRKRPAVEVRSWHPDVVLRDANATGYEIRVAQAALDEMRAEARRGRRIRGADIETGGMLLGAFDEATKTVNVDRVVGPPIDSQLSALFFRHGTVGTQDIVEERRHKTGARQGFVGLWHTHPFGIASPSATDDEGMWQLVNTDDVGRRALMIILGGDEWKAWLDEGVTPAMYARISTIAKATDDVDERRFGLVVGPETFPGGYAYPEAFHANPQEGDR